MTSTSPRRFAGDDTSGWTMIWTRPGDRFGFWSNSSVPSGFSVPSITVSVRLMARLPFFMALAILLEQAAAFVGFCFLFALRGLRLLLLVQPLLHFLGVAFVVQPEQAAEDFTAGGFTDRVTDALLRLVEAVAEVEVGPAVG